MGQKWVENLGKKASLSALSHVACFVNLSKMKTLICDFTWSQFLTAPFLFECAIAEHSIRKHIDFLKESLD